MMTLAPICSRRVRAYTCAFLLTSAMGGNAAWGQTAAPASSGGEFVTVADTIDEHYLTVTATRSVERTIKTAQDLSILTSKDINKLQSVNVSDALATLPGVDVVRTGGYGAQTSVFLRGADSGHTLVVIDGVVVNDPTSPDGGYDFGTLLAANVTKIEVLRGADSVPWGSAAMGGVINIVTKSPCCGLSASGNAELGSYNTKAANALITDKFGKLRFSLAGGWLDSAGFPTFAAWEGGKLNKPFNQAYVNGKSTLELNNSLSLDMRGNYRRSNTGIDGYPAPNYTFGDTPEYVMAQEFGGYIGANYNIHNLRNTLSYGESNIHRSTFNPQYSPAFEFGYHGKTQQISYKGEWAGTAAFKLIFGAENQRISYYDFSNSYAPHENDAYAEAIVRAAAHLTLSGGARYVNHSIYGDHVVFSANGVYNLENTTLRASYAQGYKTPTPYQLFGDGVYTAANPHLKPETSEGYDFSIQQRVSSNLHGKLTYFSRVNTNLLQYSYGALGQYQNTGRTKANGVETEVQFKPITGLNLSGNYTYAKAVDETTGLDLLRRPREILNLNADYDTDKFSLGASLARHSSSADNDSDTFTTVVLPGYTLVTLRASVPINNHLELYGRVENALDKHYEVVAHYGTLGRTGTLGVRVKH
jgi:vitamin B12 transporter